MNLISMFEESTKNNVDSNILFWDYNEKITYHELWKSSIYISGLIKSVTQSQDNKSVVLIQTIDSRNTLCAFWGSILAESIPALYPIGSDIQKHILRVTELCEKFSIKVIVADDVLYPIFMKHIQGVQIVLAGDKNDAPCPSYIDSNSSRKNTNSKSETAMLQFSSGSTGTPKGVMLSNENIISNVRAIVDRIHVQENDTVFNWLPLSHDFGIIVMHISSIMCRCDQIILNPTTFLRKPELWAQIVSEQKVSITAIPNFAMNLILRTFDEEKYDQCNLESLRVIATAGEGVSSKTCRNFEKTFLGAKLVSGIIIPAYGLAEATAAVTCVQSGQPLTICTIKSEIKIGDRIQLCHSNSEYKTRQLVGCGAPLACNKIFICDDDNNILEDGTIGNIFISGSNISQGYYMNAEASKNLMIDGMLSTGDIGFVYKNELFITGRKKDMIVLNGKNYFFSDIEKTLKDSIPELNSTEIAAFKVYNPNLEKEDLCIAIESSNENSDVEDSLEQKIRECCLKMLQINVRNVVRESSIPKTASGKVQYYILSQKYENTKDENTDSVLESMVSLLEQELDYKLSEAEYETPFYQLGIDSIKIENIFHRIEEKFKTSITMDIIWSYPTIRALSEYIKTCDPYHGEEDFPDTRCKGSGCFDNFDGNDIAIVSMACHFPGDADTPVDFWENLINQKNSIGTLGEKHDYEFGSTNSDRLGGYIKGIYDINAKHFGISPKEAQIIDPQQRLLLRTTEELLSNASLTSKDISGTNTGVFVGISSHDFSLLLSKAGDYSDIYSSLGNAISIAANRISYFYNLKGPSVAIDTACSSSLVAIHSAVRALQSDDCSAAICGGVNILLNDDISKAFDKANMLSPDGQCKTFDKDANGYVRGEGCGLVLLKRLSDALSNNDRIYAIIRGSAVNQDGKSNGLTAPNGKAQEEVIRKALSVAKMSPSEIDYIETHGTGTRLGDPIEVNTLNNVFGDSNRENNPCYIGSVKTNIGHLEAAAGVASVIKAVLILNENQIPPTLNYRELNPYIKIKRNALQIATVHNLQSRTKKTVDAIGVSSFGFGGTNCHIILSKYEKGVSITDLSTVYPQSEHYLPKYEKTNEIKEYCNMENSCIQELKAQTELLKKQLQILEKTIPSQIHSDSPVNSIQNVAAPETKEGIKKIISTITAYPVTAIETTDKLRDDLGFDSIMMGKLIDMISSAYAISDSSIQEIITVSQKEDVTVGELCQIASDLFNPSAVIESLPCSPQLSETTKSVEIQKDIYDFDEYKALQNRFNSEKYNPYYKVSYGMPLDTIETKAGSVINYSTYNYVGLNGDKNVIDESIKAIQKYGTSVSGSRMISGEIYLHQELEKEISDFLGTEDTIAYLGGYTTNVSTISTVVSSQDLILHDALSHNSIIMGAILSGSKRIPFKHNDMTSLENILAKTRSHYRRVLIVAEGIYSMDGDICDLPRLIELKKQYGAILMIDEAHSLGTIGDCGRGVGSYYNVQRSDVDLWMGTMSKSLASCGGYISGKKEWIELLKYTSNGFMFSVGLSPANAAAALASVRILRKSPEIVTKLQENSRYFLNAMKEQNLDTGLATGTAIVPCILKDSQKCIRVSKELFEKGINVMPIVYPAVPDNESRLRFFISTLHTEEEMRYTVDVLSRILNSDGNCVL